LTVAENLELAFAGSAVGDQRRRTKDEVLDLFPSLAKRDRQVAGSLSGGEQQMLSLARAFSSGPRLIIADELSHGLAPKLVDMVFATLETVKSQGVGVLIIEQFVHRALALADRCAIMQRGALVWQGQTDSAEEALDEYYWGDKRTPPPERPRSGDNLAEGKS
jgi:branched-chain amino acid transport system ATP-binding protein